jgi:hypothetical protein
LIELIPPAGGGRGRVAPVRELATKAGHITALGAGQQGFNRGGGRR